MTIGNLHIDRDIPVIEPIPGRLVGLPSLLGLDILSHFALFVEDRTNRVLLLEPAEADALPIPWPAPPPQNKSAASRSAIASRSPSSRHPNDAYDSDDP